MWRVGLVEFVHHFAALLDRHGAVQSHIDVTTFAAKPLKEIERLRVVGDQHDFVRTVGFDGGQHDVEYHEFAAVLRPEVSVWSRRSSDFENI